jgi:RNA methyltransferase, TrmH family
VKVARAAGERVYGLAAAKAAFVARPDAVLSIAHTEEQRHALADVLREAARRRIAYREVDADELTRMAQSVHHEGVCLLIRPREQASSQLLFKRVGPQGLLLALDGVQNPHNVGAILRSAAYFQAAGLVYTDSDPGRKASAASVGVSAAARRVAEGGAEHVPTLRAATLTSFVREAKRAGLVVVGSDARASVALADFVWPARSLLVMGHEQHGLTREVRSECQHLVRIPGSDHIDSLNVSVAAGIFLASYAASVQARRNTGARHGA